MPRPFSFVLAVLIAAAAVAGLFALTRSSAATGSSSPAPSADQISYRLEQLDTLEASLRKQLAEVAAQPRPAAETPLVVRADRDVEDDDHDDHDDDEEREERDD